MLDLILISAGLAATRPAAAPDSFDLHTVIARQMAVEKIDDAAQRLRPSLLDLPQEEDGARFKLRGRKIKFSLPL